MSGHIGKIYGWMPKQIGWLLTLFVILQSFGTLPGGLLRDRFRPRWTTAISGMFLGLGIFALALFRGQRLRGPVLPFAPLGLDDTNLLLDRDFLRSRRMWLSDRSHRILMSTPRAVRLVICDHRDSRRVLN